MYLLLCYSTVKEVSLRPTIGRAGSCVRLHYKSWKELFDDKEHAYLLVSILVLAHEHDPDPEMRPLEGNIDVERREELILGIATGVTAIYRCFAPQRRRMEARFTAERTAYRQAER